MLTMDESDYDIECSKMARALETAQNELGDLSWRLRESGFRDLSLRADGRRRELHSFLYGKGAPVPVSTVLRQSGDVQQEYQRHEAALNSYVESTQHMLKELAWKLRQAGLNGTAHRAARRRVHLVTFLYGDGSIEYARALESASYTMDGESALRALCRVVAIKHELGVDASGTHQEIVRLAAFLYGDGSIEYARALESASDAMDGLSALRALFKVVAIKHELGLDASGTHQKILACIQK